MQSSLPDETNTYAQNTIQGSRETEVCQGACVSGSVTVFHGKGSGHNNLDHYMKHRYIIGRLAPSWWAHVGQPTPLHNNHTVGVNSLNMEIRSPPHSGDIYATGACK
jgi:hypothetical protein